MSQEKTINTQESSIEKILKHFTKELATATESNINSYLELGFTIEFLEKEVMDNSLSRMKKAQLKIDDLKALGFENPVKMITSSPAILGYSVKENIEPKIVELKALGFENPVKMITSSPAILGYSVKENIEPKIVELKALGFENPVKMITSLPTILGYSVKENIEPKIRRIQTYLDLYEIEFSAIELVQYFPSIIGYSRLRLFKTASYLRNKNLPIKIKPLKSDISKTIIGLNKLLKK
jgi:hypothetical protein